ncbi:MAG: SHOCT domain-containing protein [Solirubrobacterales bacterium]
MAAKKHHDAKEAEQQAAPQGAAPAGPPPAAAPAAAGASEDDLTRLKELGELHSQGILTDEEFEREKSKVLEA